MSVTDTMDRGPGCSITVVTQSVRRPCLASETSEHSGDESICSFGSHETEYVRETSGSSICSYESEEAESNASREYELATSSESSGPLEYSSTDSETKRIITSSVVTWPLIELNRTESSSVEDSSAEEALRIPLPRSFEMCKRCKGMGCYPLLKLCRKCYKERRRHVLPRVKKQRKNLSKSAEKGKRRKLDPQVSVRKLIAQKELEITQERNRLKSGQMMFPIGLQSRMALNQSSSTDEDDQSASHILRAKTHNSLAKMQLSTAIQCPRVHSSSSHVEIQIPELILTKAPAWSALDAVSSASLDPRPSSSSTSGDSALTQSSGIWSGPSTSKGTATDSDKDDIAISTKDLCVICQSAPKDCAFLHQTVAHRCCCYSCAKIISETTRRCPTCKRMINRIVRLYSS